MTPEGQARLRELPKLIAEKNDPEEMELLAAEPADSSLQSILRINCAPKSVVLAPDGLIARIRSRGSAKLLHKNRARASIGNASLTMSP